MLDAAGFSPAPRSGFSVHLAAMRACERGEACKPALGSCTPFASTGCGGRFPLEMLRRGYDEEREAVQSSLCRAPGLSQQRRRACERRQPRWAKGLHMSELIRRADPCPPDELLRYGMGLPEAPLSDGECEKFGGL